MEREAGEHLDYLNIGCGSTFSPNWINIDIDSDSPHVQAYDIRKGLPYADQSFAACYHSHLLEHLSQSGAKQLLAECYRVLRPQGIIRVVVPDLAAIAHHYLQLLQALDKGDFSQNPTLEADYDWILLEMYDQSVRHVSGGEMSRYLQSPELKNQAFVLSRIGQEAESIWQPVPASKRSFWSRLSAKITSQTPAQLLTQGRDKLAQTALYLIGGPAAVKAWQIGQFRESGEVHQWMYDQFSLGRLLGQAGFTEIRRCQADQSQIQRFSESGLDVTGGQARKPDSLYMEAIKPE